MLPRGGRALLLGSPAVPSSEEAVALPGGESMADHVQEVRAGPTRQRSPWPWSASPPPPFPHPEPPYPLPPPAP